MEDEKKQCKTCRHFNRYYTKGRKYYISENTGFCIKSQSNVCIKDCCEKFEECVYSRQPSPKLLERIFKLFTEITEIRSKIEEELKE